MLYVHFLWQEEVRCVVDVGHLTRRVLCRPTEDTNMHGFLCLTQTPQKNAEAHLLPLVLASGMYAFGAADQLRAFAMQPILRKSAVSACPKTLREKNSLSSV